MKHHGLILISAASCGLGILLFAYQYEYLLFRWPQPMPTLHTHSETKKRVILHYWNQKQWHKESQEIMWTQDVSQNIRHLLQYWLRLLEEHNILSKHITVQSVALAPNGQDVYISFDRNPLHKQWSILQKWMFIEGILYTIRSNSNQPCSIFFLLHHQPLIDYHLDFSLPWPITGYQNASLQ